jgi:hypothetical protein
VAKEYFSFLKMKFSSEILIYTFSPMIRVPRRPSDADVHAPTQTDAAAATFDSASYTQRSINVVGKDKLFLQCWQNMERRE